MLTPHEAAAELLARRQARSNFADYIQYCNPKYKRSWFSDTVCAELDQFIADVVAGKRPILVFQAPPQHGKSEMVSRKFPGYIVGKFPDWRVGSASYADGWAHSLAQDARRNIFSSEHQALFPFVTNQAKDKFAVNRIGEFTSPGGTGGYLAVGVGAGLTGRPLDIGIIDDPTKNQEEALSATTKESHWNWYQTVFSTRMSEHSGQIVMATSWAEDDLPGRILTEFKGDSRLKVLRFPALNYIDESGFNSQLPIGPLVPQLHSEISLREKKKLFSDYWWSAIYQQDPKPIGGNVFKEEFIQYYLPKDLPAKFDEVICSWDCTFKDTDGTDFVVGQVWGKRGANAYLLWQARARMSFTKTCDGVVELRNKYPLSRKILIEDKANGPAVIDTLKKVVPGLLPIEPDGSKLARAHAVTAYWEARNIFLPDKAIAPWIVEFVNEITRFPAAANDDQVDAMTQALRHLFPLYGMIKISDEILKRA